MQRKLLVACAVAGLFVIALVVSIVTSQRSSVRVVSTDKRMRIDDIQYFTGKSFSYAYPRSQLWVRLQPSLGRLGLKTPFTISFKGQGPALIVLAHIQGAARSKYVDLISVDGRSADFAFPLMHVSNSDTNLFLLKYSLSGVKDTEDYDLASGSYGLRIEGETNDLAVIEVR